MILILEDNQARKVRMRAALDSAGHTAVFTFSARKALAIISMADPSCDMIVLLDYDLYMGGVRCGDGMMVARWIAASDRNVSVIVHSVNPKYAPRMMETLKAKNAIRVVPTPERDWIVDDWLPVVLRFVRAVTL